MEGIRLYFLSRCAPSELSGDVLTRFLSSARRFVFAGGRLWRRQVDGRHQLYARQSRLYALVRDAHDGAGHKGF